MIDFSVARKTQLRQKGELDAIFGVTFPMVNAYLQGKSYPRGANRTRITTILNVFTQLLESGKLPLPKEKSPEARVAAVNKIKEYISNNSTAN